MRLPVFPLLGLLLATFAPLHAEAPRVQTPPAATEPAEDRLRFLGRMATAAQIPTLLRAQPDLRTLKNAKGDNALAFALAVGTAPDTRIDQIQALLAAGFDPRTTTVDGEPAILAPFLFHPDKNLPVITLLLRHGADLKVTDSRGRNALMIYCEYGHDPATITSLLAHGFEVNTKTANNDCALDRALYSKWTEGARTLLDAGADLNLTGEPLAITARRFDTPSMNLLYDRGLKQNKHGGTALHYAITSWNFINTKYRDATDKTKLAPALLAQWEAGRTAILAFIQHAPDTVTLETDNGETALSRTQDLKIAKALIAAGADPKAPRSPKNRSISPLGTAAEKSLELTRYYIELGLDINSLADSQTPLQHALRSNGNIDTVRYLVEAGADVNLVSPRSNIATALTAAIWCYGDDKALYVDYLLAHGANPKISANYNVEACIQARRPDLLKKLVDRGLELPAVRPNDFSSPLTQAVDQNDPAMVKLLLELGANPFAQLTNNLTVIDHVRDVAKFQTDTPEKKEIFDLLTSIPSPKS